MNINIRENVFETNSSSVHAFAYLDPAAYSEFRAGKSIVLFDALKDEWDGFYHLGEDAPLVVRMGQEYADMSEMIYSPGELSGHLDELSAEYSYSDEDLDEGEKARRFFAMSGRDMAGGMPSQAWIDGVDADGYYRFRDMMVSEDRRGGATIAAEFHD